ncbi:MAG: DUF2520 domain-containing protein [Proteobacteria bacterium]|nr:DUF2520 domain-containing protein [Pseudomonadota bacterium]
MNRKKISFIGAGKVGTSLAYLLKSKGYEVIGISSRTINSAQRAYEFIGDITYSNDIYMFVEDSDVVFITTNDDSIKSVIDGIKENCEIRQGQIFIHTSGSISAEVFSPLEEKGGLGISIHPLQTIANPQEGVKNIIGSLFAIDGNEKAFDYAREIVEDLDGEPFFIESEKKPLYHLSAVIACNYFVTLMNKSVDLFKKIDIDEKMGTEGLIKLVRGTLNNIERLGTENALTGPIARGDINTIQDHIFAMKKHSPETLELYKTLGLYTVEVALKKGSIDKEKAKKINEILEKI